MQLAIFVFVEAQEIILRGNLESSKRDGDCIFLKELFSFPLDPVGVFLNIFTPTLSDVFN